MARLPRLDTLSLAEYFASEANRSRPYEYLDGQVYPLAEPSPNHEQIRDNLLAILQPRVNLERTRLYQTYKLKVGHNRVYYPDLMVISQPSPNSQYEEFPTLLIEICTWETERIDRGEKLLTYQGIPGLIGYLMVHSERRLIEMTERGLRGNWQYSAVGNVGEIELYSPSMKLDLDEVYR
jgi:Uma2 family endonuclease